METQPLPAENRPPICGLLSVAAPFASLGVAILADKLVHAAYPGDEGRFFAMAYVALPIILGLIGGMVLAGVAAFRHEKWPVLQWIGYVVNAGPFVYAFIASRA